MATSLCMVAAGCEHHNVLESASGLPIRAGLYGRGDVLIFPGATFGGLPARSLLSLDAEGVAVIPVPASPLLVKNHNLRFDQESNQMCGVFRDPKEASLFYACHSFESGVITRLTPPGYSFIDGEIADDGTRMYQLVARAEHIEDSSWYFLLEVDLETGAVATPLPVDGHPVFGSPQHITLSRDGGRVFVITAPFEEGTYRVELDKPYVLQTVDVAAWRIERERLIPPFISSAVVSEDGRYLLLYSNKYNTIYKYEPAKNILSPVMSLERSSNMLYNVWLLSTQSGVLVVDQREDQTVVRILSPDAASWETHAFDFTAYTMAEAANGRVAFREYHMTLADFEDHDRPEKQEVFHVVDLDSLSVRSSRSFKLPGEAFHTGLFYVVPGPTHHKP